MSKELEALRKLEQIIKSKEASLRSFIQEYEVIIEALKAVDVAREEDKKVLQINDDLLREEMKKVIQEEKKKQVLQELLRKEAMEASKKEREALKKTMQEVPGKNEIAKDGDPSKILQEMLQGYKVSR